MILRIKSDLERVDLLFHLTPDPEDFQVSHQSFVYNQGQISNLYALLNKTKGYGCTITLSETIDKPLFRSMDLRHLISKYGLICIDDLHITNKLTKRVSTILPHELLAMLMFDNLQYVYFERSRHIFRIDTGNEIPYGTDEWDRIRHRDDRNILKTLMVGRSLQEYFLRTYGTSVPGNAVFIYSSYKDGGK